MKKLISKSYKKEVLMSKKSMLCIMLMLVLGLLLSVVLARPPVLRGHTTSIDIGGGIHVIACDCTATEDLDCSCIIKN